MAVQGELGDGAPFWVCAVHSYDAAAKELEAAWYETIGGKKMAAGTRMKQLSWRDRVASEAVYCLVRGKHDDDDDDDDNGGGGSRNATQRGAAAGAPAPQTLSMTQKEWDIVMDSKRESERAASERNKMS